MKLPPILRQRYDQYPHVGKLRAKKSEDIMIKKIRLSYVNFILRHKLYRPKFENLWRQERNELNRWIHQHRQISIKLAKLSDPHAGL